jgi:hypothetical protein
LEQIFCRAKPLKVLLVLESLQGNSNICSKQFFVLDLLRTFETIPMPFKFVIKTVSFSLLYNHIPGLFTQNATTLALRKYDFLMLEATESWKTLVPGGLVLILPSGKIIVISWIRLWIAGSENCYHPAKELGTKKIFPLQVSFSSDIKWGWAVVHFS